MVDFPCWESADDRIDANFPKTFPDEASAKRSGNGNNLSWSWGGWIILSACHFPHLKIARKGHTVHNCFFFKDLLGSHIWVLKMKRGWATYQMKSLQWQQKVGCLKNLGMNLWSFTWKCIFVHKASSPMESPYLYLKYARGTLPLDFAKPS